MSKRSQLRNRYYKETYKYWKTMNTTATPTIEYAKWLENIILDSERQTPDKANDTDKSEVLNIPLVSKSVCPKCGNTGRCEPRTLSDPDGQECDCGANCC